MVSPAPAFHRGGADLAGGRRNLWRKTFIKWATKDEAAEHVRVNDKLIAQAVLDGDERGRWRTASLLAREVAV